MLVFISVLTFALSVTVPNILLLILGKLLKIKGIVSHEFCEQSAELVFKCALPLLLFTNLIHMHIDYTAQAKLIFAGIITTLVLYGLAEIYAYFHIPKMQDKGVFVQGVFRHNIVIIGLAFVQNAYGQQGVSASAVYIGLVTILLNILSVITLSRTQNQSIHKQIKEILNKITSNPLIIAICIALIMNALHISLPKSLLKTFKYLSNIALPLALICAGATFNWKSIQQITDVSLQASLGRLIIAPLVAIAIGYVFNFRGLEMGILFLTTTTPVAATSYVMAKAMKCNDVAAANIIGITTVGAMFSVSIGIIILRSLNLM